MVDLKGFSKKYLYNGFGGGEASESAKLFDDTRECKFDLGAFVFEDGKELDAYEHELDLLAEEFELPLGLGAMAADIFGSTWVDDLVEESNRYFKSQYEEAAAAKRPALSTTSTVDASASAQERAPAVASLFQLSAAAVAAHLVPEVGLPGFGLPEEVLEAVQRRMPKERQIACFGNYKRWEPRTSVLLGLGGSAAEDVDVVRREREAWVLVKSCPYDGLGRKHGLAVEWRPDGSLWRTTRFEFGARSGTHVEYFADGRRALKACYKAGVLHGNLKWWYDVPAAAHIEEPSSAMVVARSARKHLAGVQAYVDGRKEGEGRVWREDGTLWRTKHYRGDLKHGIWRTFDQSGRVIKCSHYDNAGVKRKAGAAQLTTSCPGVALLLPSMDSSASLDDRF